MFSIADVFSLVAISHLKSCISEKFPELLDSAKPEREKQARYIDNTNTPPSTGRALQPYLFYCRF